MESKFEPRAKERDQEDLGNVGGNWKLVVGTLVASTI